MRAFKIIFRMLLIVAVVLAGALLLRMGADVRDGGQRLLSWGGALLAAVSLIALLPRLLRHALGALIQWTIALAGLVAVAAGLAQANSPSGLLIAAGGALVFIIVFRRRVVFPARLRRNRRTVPATIVRISHKARIGDAAMMRRDLPHGPVVAGTETYVLFDSRGERINVRLTPGQAREFAERYSEGDTGRLTYSLGRLLSWEPPTPEHPIVDARNVRVFLSYAHEWMEDAEYIAQFFRSEGLTVWFDKSQLRVGDRLSQEIVKAVQACSYFIPLLAAEYWNSEWCIKEFELAASAGIVVLPIKVTAGQMAIPPHIRHLFRDQLGDPIFLDLRERNPVEQLKALSARMRDT